MGREVCFQKQQRLSANRGLGSRSGTAQALDRFYLPFSATRFRFTGTDRSFFFVAMR